MSSIEDNLTEYLQHHDEIVENHDEAYSPLIRSHLDLEHENEIRLRMETIGEEFLALETYVNLNYLGCQEVLKTHDQLLPIPCYDIRSDYSDIMVRMSALYSKLRRDKVAKPFEHAKQVPQIHIKSLN